MSDQLPDTPRGRRAMFRVGVKRLLEPLAAYVEQRLEPPVPAPSTRRHIRPPGALPEDRFLDTCYRCGNCVDICPAKAIRPLSNGDAAVAGTPHIDPDLAACTLCADLSCMKACPSGALLLVSDLGAIRMGVARLDQGLCIRHRGQDCSACIEICPIGTAAIGLTEGGEVTIHEAGCVGCGMCQLHCPTLPKAVRIEAI